MKVLFRIDAKSFAPIDTITSNILNSLFFTLGLLAAKKYDRPDLDIESFVEIVANFLSNYSTKYAMGIYSEQECRNLAVKVVGIQAKGQNNIKGPLSSDASEIILNLTPLDSMGCEE